MVGFDSPEHLPDAILPGFALVKLVENNPPPGNLSVKGFRLFQWLKGVFRFTIVGLKNEIAQVGFRDVGFGGRRETISKSAGDRFRSMSKFHASSGLGIRAFVFCLRCLHF